MKIRTNVLYVFLFHIHYQKLATLCFGCCESFLFQFDVKIMNVYIIMFALQGNWKWSRLMAFLDIENNDVVRIVQVRSTFVDYKHF